MKKFLIILVLAAGVVGLTFVIKPREPIVPVHPAQEQEQETTARVEADYVVYSGQEGKTAFELLQSVTAVEFQQYDFGVFVQNINGVKPDDKHFWKLYVNGAESQVGADQFQTQNGDLIEWKLEEIR